MDFVDPTGRPVDDDLEGRLGPSVKSAIKKVFNKALEGGRALPGEKTYLVDDDHVEIEHNVAFGVSDRPLHERIGIALLSYFDSMMAVSVGQPNPNMLFDKKYRQFISKARRGLSFKEFLRLFSIPTLKDRIDQLQAAVGSKVSPDDARTGKRDWRDFFKRRKRGLVSENVSEITYWTAVMSLESAEEFLRLSKFEQDKVIEEASHFILVKNKEGKEIRKKLERCLGEIAGKDSESGLITE